MVERKRLEIPFLRGRDLREFGLIGALLLIGIILSILSPVFMTISNLLDIVLQSSINATIALGMTFVIATGGIDLSVGSIWALAGIIIGLILKSSLPWWLALLGGLLVGSICGCVTGTLIVRGRMQPFIATLGTMGVFRGLALIISKGYTIYSFPRSFRFLGSGKVFAIPVPVLILLCAFLIARFMFEKTTFGRHIVAIGGNREAARLCGINVNLTILKAYMICGILTGLAAIMATARLNAAEPIAGSSAELDAIAAVVMGGTSLSGGMGNIGGTLIGALLIGVVKNGLTLLNVPVYYQTVAIGLIIIAAVLLEGIGKKE
jgi:ribose/xylose/arabinose/galactoside ABC-type transport system permease subunit